MTDYGVDTGGTFTDVIRRLDDGGLQVHKLLSTPADPSEAIAEGVERLRSRSREKPALVHGTTVATNALLERQGAEVALVTTAGFEDLLWLRRQNRPRLYALDIELPIPLVDESLCFGADERVGADGAVIQPLVDTEIDRLVERIAEADPEAVVIGLLHSYANPEHERRLAEALRSVGGWHVTASSEVAATFREYERVSTATVNGYVGPVMERYLDRLTGRLDNLGGIEVLQSHGGRASVEHAGRLPVHTVLSGPAGGVVGALGTAEELDVDRVISFDMGGTSTDVSLADGEPTLTEEATIGGLPIQVPVIDIHTVGAGGGSIAYVDPGGALRVGPRSAGADPGPVAYGRGGEEPTVTDAHVVLGTLRADRFLGGRMRLAADRAQRAVAELADELGSEVRETARGILEVADAAMSRAIKVISLERGHDPRDYALVAFGGAGGLHGCRLAEKLEMSKVIVPRHPGLASAVGMLRAAPRRLYSKTVLEPMEAVLDGEALRRVDAAMEELEQRARKAMAHSDVTMEWAASLRYAGQSFSIPVDVDWRAGESDWTDPRPAFETMHDRLYGYRDEQRAVELVDLRLEARVDGPSWATEAAEESEGEPEREIVVVDTGDGPAETAVVDRSELAEGVQLEGPAVITEYSGTTVVLAGWRVRTENGHLVLERS